MPDKKIVFVVSEFPVLSETFILNKFLGLLEKGWDAHMVCTRRGRLDRKQEKAFEGRVHSAWPARPRFLAVLLSPYAFFYTLFLRPLPALRYLKKGFKQFGFRIFKYFYLDAGLIRLAPALIHFEFGALAVGKTYLKELLSCEMTVSFRGYDLNFSGIEDPDYYSEVWKAVDGIHCLGEDLWKTAQQRGCPQDKLHALIPPAIDAEFFKPDDSSSAKERRPLHLLSVGRLEWKKGYEFSLQACRILKDEGISFEYRIVGHGNYLEAAAFCRHQLDLEDSVSFLGAQDQQEIMNHMKWADVFLHAAVTEGFCNAVLEAQAMQLPVVCTDAGGLPANVADGETGFVVPRRVAEAFAEKIQQLAENPELRLRMGRAGRKRVFEKFRLQDQLQAFENFYSKVLKDKDAKISN